MAKTTKAVTPKPDRRKSVKSTTSTITTQDTSTNSTGEVFVNISQSDIARRAFEMYCARGGGQGSALDDWLQAERELRQAQQSHSN
jgi:hypothetical protein